jgi:DNA-binding NarL/FixJ family response regulator
MEDHSAESPLIHVAIAAATQAERIGLRALLETDDGLTVSAGAADLSALEGLAPPPDVVVVTAEALGRLPEDPAGTPAAVLLLSDDPEDIRALQNPSGRAWGLLPRDCSREELLAAVHAVYQGLAVLPPLLAGRWLERVAPPEDVEESDVPGLTPRENEVLQLLAQGLANKQIAVAMNISEHTVKFHVTSIYNKLGASNRADVIRRGFECGLIVL